MKSSSSPKISTPSTPVVVRLSSRPYRYGVVDLEAEKIVDIDAKTHVTDHT